MRTPQTESGERTANNKLLVAETGRTLREVPLDGPAERDMPEGNVPANEGEEMTDNQKAEAFALKLIDEHQGSLAYWSISNRTHAALKRLQKRGVIRWTVENYPVWKFEILKRKVKQ